MTTEAIRSAQPAQAVRWNEAGVRGLRLRGPSGTTELAVDGVFLYVQGQRPVTDWLRGVLPLGGDGCLPGSGDHATAVAGLYAVGDVRCGAEVKQAVIAAAQGAEAAVQAERFLRGRTAPTGGDPIPEPSGPAGGSMIRLGSIRTEVGFMQVARFFATSVGRGVRVAAGGVLLLAGLLGGTLWSDAVGLVLVLAGALDVCGLAVLFGGPFDGGRAGRRS